MGSAIAWERGNVLPDWRRVRNLHNFRGRLHFLHREECGGPDSQDVLELPIFSTICLLSSSLTIHLAVRALRQAKVGAFGLWWFITMALGTFFLISTGREWHHLIYDKGLTVSTNLFGTTYYSLVGLHAFHVTVGLLMIALAMVFTLFRKVKPEHSERAEVFSLYWHFVDAVWVIVFTVVYIIGR